MEDMIKPFVIVIAGPTGVGKTALAKVIKKHFGCSHLSEDEIAKEIFPETYKDIEDYPEKVETIARQLYIRSRNIFENGKSVVIERINLEELRKKYPEAFKRPYHADAGLRVERVLVKEIA